MAKINHWIAKVADQVERFTDRRKGEGAKVICASGISPSGVIHLGNLREILTVHLVTEELLRRGRDAEHLHFWDDYDRFRKVPMNVPEDFSKYIGQPLAEIPDPEGEFDSYATRFKKQFEECMEQIGVRPTYVHQEKIYKAGTYNEQVKTAIANRHEIFDVLLSYMKEEKQEEIKNQREDYYPFKVFCSSCKTDDTNMTGYNAATAEISYACTNCGHTETYSLNDKVQGKLVWKVDWPMRWHHYEVDFEPGGVDHSTPGSSYTVGKELVQKVYENVPPQFVGYSFVGIAGGSAKISSSAGSGATPESALAVLEPAILRWMYVRADVRSSFTINFDEQMSRLYDEWDRFATKVQSGKGSDKEQLIFDHCVKTSVAEVPFSQKAVPFKLLTNGYEITQGNVREMARIVSSHTEYDFTEESFKEEIGMRYRCASNYVDDYQSEDEKLQIKPAFDQALFDSFDDDQQQAVKLLVEQFEDHWSLQGLTTLFYGIPKQMLGLPADTKPTEELKALQRKFFIAVYMLITGTDTGPRLPTLLLSLGKERVHKILSPQ